MLTFKHWIRLNESANGQLSNNELVSISGTTLDSTGHKLNPIAAAAYSKMVAAAKKDGVEWGITDSYRSLEAQKDVARRKGLYSQGGLAAAPGTSNHGLGSAVDLNFSVGKGDAFKWLKKNAATYGFTTIPRERWHWEHTESAKSIKSGNTLSNQTSQTKPISDISGNTPGEKILNNQVIVNWLFNTLPELTPTLTPASLNKIFAENPEHFEWFKNKFGLNDKGDPIKTPDLSSDSKDTEELVDSELSNKEIKSTYSSDKANNIKILTNEITSQGVTNKYAIIGILSTIGKESGFVPQNEQSYANTPNDRIKKLFGSRVNNLSDTELTSLKQNPPAFFDKIYGPEATSKIGWNTGNTSSGDGYKYRGRGFNQLTFKSNYQKYADITGIDIVSNPDQLNDVSVAAKVSVAFLLNGLKKLGIDPNSFKNKREAIKAFVQVNAGGSSAPSDELAKAEEVSKNFTLV